jgi:hypothetical protein
MVNAWQTVPDPSSVAPAVIAHGIGVVVPVLSSYFGHKHISFPQRS